MVLSLTGKVFLVLPALSLLCFFALQDGGAVHESVEPRHLAAADEMEKIAGDLEKVRGRMAREEAALKAAQERGDEREESGRKARVQKLAAKAAELTKRLAALKAAQKERLEAAKEAAEKRKELAEEERLHRLAKHELLMEERRKLHALNSKRREQGLPEIPYTPVLKSTKIPETLEGLRQAREEVRQLLEKERSKLKDAEDTEDKDLADAFKVRIRTLEKHELLLREEELAAREAEKRAKKELAARAAEQRAKKEELAARVAALKERAAKAKAAKEKAAKEKAAKEKAAKEAAAAR